MAMMVIVHGSRRSVYWKSPYNNWDEEAARIYAKRMRVGKVESIELVELQQD